MTEPPTPPDTATPGNGPGDLAQELAGLRAHLRLLEELDQQTAEMVIRLADAVRSSNEVRAQVSLEVAAALGRVERLVAERNQRQREALAAFRQDVTVAHSRAVGLATMVQSIEQEIRALQARLAAAESAAEGDDEPAAEPEETEPAEPDTSSESRPEAPRSMPAGPQPAASSILVEVEEVPSASAALSFQRFVAGLAGVVAATTREYAAGHLRLEVRTRGPVGAAELTRWPDGELEILESSAGTIRLRMTP